VEQLQVHGEGFMTLGQLVETFLGGHNSV
jgi:hypothetical protein